MGHIKSEMLAPVRRDQRDYKPAPKRGKAYLSVVRAILFHRNQRVGSGMCEFDFSHSA